MKCIKNKTPHWLQPKQKMNYQNGLIHLECPGAGFAPLGVSAGLDLNLFLLVGFTGAAGCRQLLTAQNI